jgi:hypothetical protein
MDEHSPNACHQPSILASRGASRASLLTMLETAIVVDHAGVDIWMGRSDACFQRDKECQAGATNWSDERTSCWFMRADGAGA